VFCPFVLHYSFQSILTTPSSYLSMDASPQTKHKYSIFRRQLAPSRGLYFYQTFDPPDWFKQITDGGVSCVFSISIHHVNHLSSSSEILNNFMATGPYIWSISSPCSRFHRGVCQSVWSPYQLSSLTSHSGRYTIPLHGNIPDPSIAHICGNASLRPAGA
jgi:hypothetical protein